MVLPDLFTALQARVVSSEASNDPALINVALAGLRTVLREYIEPAARCGGSSVYIAFSVSREYYYLRWRIKAALEVNGFRVVESWQGGVMWKVSWGNE